ncbi:MAG: hypothetical protein PHH54_06300 [Candidatus Nanoarchaeia archaeon]|nr:hypothetical protein [Candidatus Nanoarchaeia archaeon]
MKKLIIVWLVSFPVIFLAGCGEQMSITTSKGFFNDYLDDEIIQRKANYKEGVNTINKLALEIQEVREKGSAEEKQAIEEGKFPKYREFLQLVQENQKEKQEIIREVLVSDCNLNPSDIWMEKNPNLVYVRYNGLLIQIQTLFVGQVRARMANEAMINKDFNFKVSPDEKYFRKMELLSNNLALPTESPKSYIDESTLRKVCVLREAYNYREVWILGTPWSAMKVMIQIADMPLDKLVRLQSKNKDNPLVFMLEVEDPRPEDKKIASPEESEPSANSGWFIKRAKEYAKRWFEIE